MIGGEVIGLARGPDGTLLNVESPEGDWCAIRVIERRIKDDAPIQINLGDGIWWNGKTAYWTPNRGLTADNLYDGETFDIRLLKIGNAH